MYKLFTPSNLGQIIDSIFLFRLVGFESQYINAPTNDTLPNKTLSEANDFIFKMMENSHNFGSRAIGTNFATSKEVNVLHSQFSSLTFHVTKLGKGGQSTSYDMHGMWFAKIG